MIVPAGIAPSGSAYHHHVGRSLLDVGGVTPLSSNLRCCTVALAATYFHVFKGEATRVPLAISNQVIAEAAARLRQEERLLGGIAKAVGIAEKVDKL